MCSKSVKDSYFARFHIHCYRETHFNSRLNVNFDKCRSRASGHGACLKSVSSVIIMQDFLQLSHCYREMHCISTLDINFLQSQWRVKRRSRAPGHGAWLKSVLRTMKKGNKQCLFDTPEQ